LSNNILRSQTPKDGETPYFHNASHSLNVIYAMIVLLGMNLSWNVAELPVHVYFNTLLENRYKKSYALICNEFTAQLNFIIFKKKGPRLTTTGKKIISKLGHWYLLEKQDRRVIK